MQTGDVIEIDHVMLNDLVGVEMHNVYHYFLFDASAGELNWAVAVEETAERFMAGIGVAVRAVQHINIIHQKLVFRNMNTPFEEGEFDLEGITGTALGDPAPSFVTLGFKYIRQATTTRHGRKSVGGLVETYTTGNNGASLAGNAAITQIASYMSLPIVVESDFDQDLTWHPCIYRKVSPELGPPVTNFIRDVVYRSNGTQNSRKK